MKKTENVSEEIMAENFSSLKKETDPGTRSTESPK